MTLIMPPTLGAAGIMFSGCSSARPSEAWNTLFLPVHGSIGPSDQPWPFCGMSVRPSVCPSVRRGFRAFPRERMEGIAWNFACWCILSTSRIHQFMVAVDFSNFSTILIWWNGSNLGFPGISWRTQGGNGLKFCKLMYLGPLQNWLDYGHALLIF